MAQSMAMAVLTRDPGYAVWADHDATFMSSLALRCSWSWPPGGLYKVALSILPDVRSVYCSSLINFPTFFRLFRISSVASTIWLVS